MTGPSPLSIDLNHATANSKGPKHLGAAAMTGAHNLLDDLSAERAPPSMAPSTVQVPPSYPQTMPTTVPYPSTEQAPQPPPIDTHEDTTVPYPGNMNIEEEPLFADELTQAAARGRRVSKRTSNYTVLEDKVLVNGWLTIGQDALIGAEQKETAFWRRIYEYFHEHRKYGLEPFESDRSELSLQKRWGTIQTDTQEDTTVPYPGNMNIEEEPLFADELTQAAARGRQVSKRTSNYMVLEGKVLINGWLTIGQDALTGAEQKGTAFWRRICEYFHEHRKYGLEPFESDRSELSLQKRWGTIQTECNKFQAAYDHVKRMPVSGMGMKDLV
ncbi:uncharacterized protein [Lolium perenne]|uniref:uncharacterized protein n=1 Tax=Lolium perenne TaxID=4522 RepID=UPI003A98FDF7